MTAIANLDTSGTEAFRYGDFDLDARTGTLTCSYFAGGRRFTERVVVEGGSASAPGAEEAASLVFLLSGVSYYKAFAPPVVDLGTHEVTPLLRSFLRQFYVEGLGEFGYHNGLDLRGLTIVGGRESPQALPASEAVRVDRPLVPFGGGMDSLVSVEFVRRCTPDAALFVVNRPGDRFRAIETAAAATGLPLIRATRELDPVILRSQQLGFRNGHVPVTGILSAIALLAAVMTRRDAVVMSNEWSASIGNVESNGQLINHQYSKSVSFERAFRDVVRSRVGTQPDYFSLLRPFSELWIAREFAHYPQYIEAFRSCNRAFHIDLLQRLDTWCGRCDKCLFIDLILSPFVSHRALSGVFQGNEPLDNVALLDTFRTLIGANAEPKPFECVGDVEECRAAVLLAARRADRSGSTVLESLRDDVHRVTAAVPVDVERLLAPIGEHFIPEPYATALRLA